jgi:hypothetical protein
MKNKFLFTFVDNNCKSASSVVFDDFETALSYMDKECSKLSIYPGTETRRKVGVNMLRAVCKIQSKYVDITLQIAQLTPDENNQLSTCGWDYDLNNIALP